MKPTQIPGNTFTIDRSTSDAIKGLLILFIVLGHNVILTDNIPHLFEWLYPAHVMAFMILPWLYNRSAFSLSRLKKRFFKIYIPYAVFYILLYLIFNFILTQNGFNWRLFVSAFFFGGNTMLKESTGFAYLWFLPAYFFMMLFKDLYYTVKSKVRIMIAIAVISFTVIYCWYTHDELGFFQLQAVAQGLYVASFGLIISKLPDVVWGKLIYAVFFVFIAYTVIVFCGVNIPWYIRSIFPLVAFVVVAYSCRKQFRFKSVFEKLGRLSLYIYLIHSLIYQAIVQTCRFQFTETLSGGIIIYIVTLILSWAISLMITKIPFLKTV